LEGGTFLNSFTIQSKFALSADIVFRKIMTSIFQQSIALAIDSTCIQIWRFILLQFFWNTRNF